MNNKHIYYTQPSFKLYGVFAFFWLNSFGQLLFFNLNTFFFSTTSLIAFLLPVIMIDYSRIKLTESNLIIENWKFIMIKSNTTQIKLHDITSINYVEAEQNPAGILLTGVKSKQSPYLIINYGNNTKYFDLNYCKKSEIEQIITLINNETKP